MDAIIALYNDNASAVNALITIAAFVWLRREIRLNRAAVDDLQARITKLEESFRGFRISISERVAKLEARLDDHDKAVR